MKRPITIDGTPVITSARKRTTRRERRLAAVLVEVDAAEDPERDRHHGAAPVISSVPTTAGPMPGRTRVRNRDVLGEERPARSPSMPATITYR